MHDFHHRAFQSCFCLCEESFFSEHFRQKVSLKEDIKGVILQLLSQKPAI